MSVTDEDIEPIITAQWRRTLFLKGRWPAVAVVAAGCALGLNSHLSAAIFGAAIAWTWGLVDELRDLRRDLVAYYAPMKEEFEIDVRGSGLRFHGRLGEADIRWEAVTGIRNLPGLFEVEFGDDATALIPKRCLTTEELLVIASHSGREPA